MIRRSRRAQKVLRGVGDRSPKCADREGPVQQESGDHEKDAHPDLQPAGVAPVPVPGGDAGHEGGVHRDDRQGRKRPETIEAREANCGSGRSLLAGPDEVSPGSAPNVAWLHEA